MLTVDAELISFSEVRTKEEELLELIVEGTACEFRDKMFQLTWTKDGVGITMINSASRSRIHSILKSPSTYRPLG